MENDKNSAECVELISEKLEFAYKNLCMEDDIFSSKWFEHLEKSIKHFNGDLEILKRSTPVITQIIVMDKISMGKRLSGFFKRLFGTDDLVWWGPGHIRWEENPTDESIN